MPYQPLPRRVLAAAVFVAIAATGCAANKVETASQLGESRGALEAAQASLGNSDSPDLAIARARLAEAQDAARKGDHALARRKADEADAAAALARSKGARDRSEKASDELDRSLASLRDELNRQPGAGGPGR
ncbi:hypothetical protein CDN99_16285 [Roseateles aquatilis]|uniref:DUF4398 domain-containing protein n=1 Tax=Roseateles aquatilis TaxID=431061 RepID=A0A246J7B1_9BURK|nr:DUF4398 domain-containing protein [Roseateles aquatilis]OWQ88416.1 hypothetical protein CDN99_16285 [Roseateles aquatilis]